ncbi:nuclear transport factor 2 family protein [Hyphomicrobium sp. CS1GBMeth3]|uniref:nuclear transport factor 2 family protein n=1 Tax=Hyphomicrobium sp. CS1GBMeth3 TaxID=1892845 RepID=UPI00093078DA|nr:nuclear transport factor 2 family protein [Hyphomicrobium sp. CS1GBMeth3]
MQSPHDVVHALLHQWAADPAGAMKTKVAPDVVYTLNVSPDALPLGGETVGWDAVNEILLGIRKIFDYLVYKPRILSVDGNVVRARIELVLRHRPSGEVFTGQMRSVFTVRDGLVTRVDEYVDAPMVETFMRLVSGGEGESG